MRDLRSIAIGLPALAAGLLASTGCAAWQRVAGCEDEQPRPDRPNIVVFVADDMGWRDIGYHESECRTPNLDRLAGEGVRLEQFYVYPTCSPTRAAFLTGRCPSRYGILGPIGGRSTQALPDGEVTLASRLSGLGYRTAITGKWHLGLRPEVGPRKYGFDFSYGYLHGQVDPYTHLYKNGDPTWHRNDELIAAQGHVTDLLTREAISFIESNRDTPFFLYVPYSVPHYPLNEPDEWTGPYKDVVENDSRRWLAASVSHMDDSIGRVCEALDRLRLRDNTLVVFFSDNGGQKSWSSRTEYEGRYPPHDTLGDNRPLRGWKGQLYEGGIRVPALMHWPSRLAPRTVDAPVSVLDLLPTLVSLAGGDASGDGLLEGSDMRPLLTGQGESMERELYWKTGGQFAVRVGDWKLVESADGNQRELFDLSADPYEQRDLAGEHPEVVRKLRDVLIRNQAKDPAGRPIADHLRRYKLKELVLEPRTDQPAAFDSQRVECPMVVRWRDRWLMYYTGITSSDGKVDSTIGVATSDDLVHWRDRRQVLGRGPDGAFDHGGLSGPFVWVEGDRLNMIYIGFPQLGYESRPGRHGLAWSSDGLEWTKADFNPVHDPGPAGSWNDACLFKPFVMRHDGRYWMFYNAFGTRDGCEQIGLATSSDLQVWTEHPGNPLLRKGDPVSDRDQVIIGDPWILRHDDQWEMYYFAFDGRHAREHLATSQDLVHWEKSAHNPVMDAGPAGSYDEVHCHKPCIISHGGVQYHFYTAVGTKGEHQHYRAIGLATSKRVPGVSYR